MRLYPAVDVLPPCSTERVLVAVDDWAPTALEELADRIRVFFSSPAARDAGCAALNAAGCATSPLDVDDEDWARRSQEALHPVTIGRITIRPQPFAPDSSPAVLRPLPPAIEIVIQPSTGFGTGHHATTRYCLEALQRIPLAGAIVMDVGTGSGVLAIAASRLGAAHSLGIDVDEDAIRAARENLWLNPDVHDVYFLEADIEGTTDPAIRSANANVTAANLTGTLLVRLAPTLVAATRPDGWLVLSGILFEERDAVVAAFGGAIEIVDERLDGEWVGLTMKKR